MDVVLGVVVGVGFCVEVTTVDIRNVVEVFSVEVVTWVDVAMVPVVVSGVVVEALVD